MQKLSSPLALIKKSINLFFDKKNLPYLLIIYLPLLPFSIFSILQSYFVKTLDLKILGLMIFPIAILEVVNLVVSFWIYPTAIFAVGNIYKGGNLTIKDTFSQGWKKAWKYFLLSGILTLIILGGLLLLVIPAIIFGVWYGFSYFVAVEEDKSLKESLARSKELVKGRFWAIFGREIVFGLFSLLIGLALSFIPFGIGNVFLTMVGALFLFPTYLLYKELVYG